MTHTDERGGQLPRGGQIGDQSEQTLSEIERAAEEQTRALCPDQFATMKRYVDSLTTTGVTRGLLGPREPHRIWSRHVLNCAALCPLLPEGSDILDVGSGAGLPGIIIAVIRPDLRVSLLEPMLRRCVYLGEVIDELDLADRLTVIRGRAENYRGSHEIVTARAVARLGKLLRWTAPLIAPSGRLLALKGDSAQQEIDEAAGQLSAAGLVADLLRVRAYPQAEATNVVRVTRN